MLLSPTLRPTEGFIQLKPPAEAFNVACGKEEGQLKLYDRLEARGTGSSHATMYQEVVRQIHRSDTNTCTVQVIDLDHFIQREGIRKVHLLKVDTEGHDLSVLLGIRNSIESGIVDVVHFEFNEMNVFSRTFLRDFRNVLPGYVFFRMLPDGLVPLGEYIPLVCELFAYQNIVAVPERCLPGQKGG